MTHKIPPLVGEIIAVSHQICKKESNIEIVRDSVKGTFVSLALVQLPVGPYESQALLYFRGVCYASSALGN